MILVVGATGLVGNAAICNEGDEVDIAQMTEEFGIRLTSVDDDARSVLGQP